MDNVAALPSLLKWFSYSEMNKIFRLRRTAFLPVTSNVETFLVVAMWSSVGNSLFRFSQKNVMLFSCLVLNRKIFRISLTEQKLLIRLN